MKLFQILVFLLLVLGAGVPTAHGLSVKSLSLAQMVELSERIFKGTLLEVTVDRDTFESGHMVNYYTFKVDEVIKGDLEDQVVIKQLAQGPRGLPEYEVGQTYLLFFPEDSDRTGLVAPVGIWQGQHRMTQVNGEWVIPGLTQNSRLIQSAPASLVKGLVTNLSSSPAAAIHYESIKKLLQQVEGDS